jgi:putative addiction module killer protein
MQQRLATSAIVRQSARVSVRCAFTPGPGYRVYYTRRDLVVYLLLLGGDKSTQSRDIKRAIKMARELEERA